MMKNGRTEVVHKLLYKPLFYWTVITAVLGIIAVFVPNLSTVLFAVVAFFFSSLAFILSNAGFFTELRDRKINENEKRLEKFYWPTKRLLENLQRNNFAITSDKDEIIKELENIAQYKYLAKKNINPNKDTKESFIKFKDSFSQCVMLNETCLDQTDNSLFNTLLNCVKDDIDLYEMKIEENLESLE